MRIAGLLTINTASYLFNGTLSQTVLTTLPLRLLNLYYERNSYQLLKEEVAFIVLFFPHGPLLSAGVDLVAEVLHYYSHLKPTPMALTREKACKILGLQPGDENNKELVRTKCKNTVETFTPKLTQAGGLIATQLQTLIDNAKAAYQTLTGEEYRDV
jgi:hypothetical protein